MFCHKYKFYLLPNYQILLLAIIQLQETHCNIMTDIIYVSQPLTLHGLVQNTNHLTSKNMLTTLRALRHLLSPGAERIYVL